MQNLNRGGDPKSPASVNINCGGHPKSPASVNINHGRHPKSPASVNINHGGHPKSPASVNINQGSYPKQHASVNHGLYIPLLPPPIFSKSFGRFNSTPKGCPIFPPPLPSLLSSSSALAPDLGAQALAPTTESPEHCRRPSHKSCTVPSVEVP